MFNILLTFMLLILHFEAFILNAFICFLPSKATPSDIRSKKCASVIKRNIGAKKTTSTSESKCSASESITQMGEV
ncbi:hypothetical protein AAZX31_07G152000 [Glycine max]|nr:hypothetical protein GLYMA_07G163050v4 [Glycine max]KAH1087140.1 hypothetical protein GYH30_018606 [Glycine max]